MTIKIVVSNVFGFPVKGTFLNEQGKEEAFSFTLFANRPEQEALRAELSPDNHKGLSDFLLERVTGWRGVIGEDKQEVPFDTEAFRQLLAMPALANLAFNAYIANCGARAKN